MQKYDRECALKGFKRHFSFHLAFNKLGYFVKHEMPFFCVVVLNRVTHYVKPKCASVEGSFTLIQGGTVHSLRSFPSVYGIENRFLGRCRYRSRLVHESWRDEEEEEEEEGAGMRRRRRRRRRGGPRWEGAGSAPQERDTERGDRLWRRRRKKLRLCPEMKDTFISHWTHGFHSVQPCILVRKRRVFHLKRVLFLLLIIAQRSHLLLCWMWAWSQSPAQWSEGGDSAAQSLQLTANIMGYVSV